MSHINTLISNYLSIVPGYINIYSSTTHRGSKNNVANFLILACG